MATWYSNVDISFSNRGEPSSRQSRAQHSNKCWQLPSLTAPGEFRKCHRSAVTYPLVQNRIFDIQVLNTIKPWFRAFKGPVRSKSTKQSNQEHCATQKTNKGQDSATSIVFDDPESTKHDYELAPKKYLKTTVTEKKWKHLKWDIGKSGYMKLIQCF